MARTVRWFRIMLGERVFPNYVPGRYAMLVAAAFNQNYASPKLLGLGVITLPGLSATYLSEESRPFSNK